MTEQIEQAAIRENGVVYTLPRPARHHDIIRMMVEEHGFKHVNGGAAQGFVTSTGRFVDRRMARILAVRAGQLEHAHLPQHRAHQELFSEDLW